MKRRDFLSLAVVPALYPLGRRQQGPSTRTPTRRTALTIRGDAFHINGRPTYAGRAFNGKKVEGLLMNTRMVQGMFNDLTPETATRFVYPDTGKWDPDRNTNEFIAAMPEWKRHGVLAFTINLQGGGPGGGGGRGRGAAPGAAGTDAAAPGAAGGGARADAGPGQATAAPQGGAPVPARGAGGGRGPAGPAVENTAIDPDGNLRPAYMLRLQRILDKADEIGMAVIVGYYYFGQDQRMKEEDAIKRGVVNATNWILDHGYTNVIIEVNNECNINYDHDILKPPRVPELFDLVRQQSRDGRHLMVTSSFAGRSNSESPETPVPANVAKSSDFFLIHGNGPYAPDAMRRAIAGTRVIAGGKPILINEDPNFHFTESDNHVLAAVDQYCSWGYYDQGQNNYQDGYQSPPVNWGINTESKKQFFELIKKITGV